MKRATALSNHQCISSEDVQGTEVYGPDGKNIGEIDHLIIDKISGRVGYAVMSFGGFLGLGQPLSHPVGCSFIRQVAWWLPDQHYGGAAKRRTRVQ